MAEFDLPVKRVLDHPLTALCFAEQIRTILRWANGRESKVVCVANVHMLMEARWNNELAAVLQKASLVTPDGMPLVWLMRLLGAADQDRVAGMDLFLALCQIAPLYNVKILLLGSQKETLNLMKSRLERDFPGLQLAGMEPLPFRPLTQSEDEALIEKINGIGAGLVMVSLGCPKQEYWMAQHQDKIEAVMVGVGGVFPVYAGIQKRAPRWVRELGLEWFYRLAQEPRRLWRRYYKTIPPFIWLALKQLLTQPRAHMPNVSHK